MNIVSMYNNQPTQVRQQPIQQAPQQYQYQPPTQQPQPQMMDYQPADQVQTVQPVTDQPQNSINVQTCTIDEIKGYVNAMLQFLPPGQGLTYPQTQTLVGMIMGLKSPEAVRMQATDAQGRQVTTQERLLIVDQDNNSFNKGRRPQHAQLINKPKNPLSNHHLADPKEMRRMAEFDMSWQTSQRGVPDATGQQENQQLFQQYPY